MANFEILTSWVQEDSGDEFPNTIILHVCPEYISKDNITTDDIANTISTDTGLEYNTQFTVANFWNNKFITKINDRVKIMLKDNEVLSLFKLTYS